MKKILLLTTTITLLIAASAANAEWVNGYTRSNGTSVQGYERSDRDGTVTNNYSYEGNVNPSTGEVGHNHYTHDATSPYFNGTPDSQGRIGHSGYDNEQ